MPPARTKEKRPAGATSRLLPAAFVVLRQLPQPPPPHPPPPQLLPQELPPLSPHELSLLPLSKGEQVSALPPEKSKGKPKTNGPLPAASAPIPPPPLLPQVAWAKALNSSQQSSAKMSKRTRGLRVRAPRMRVSGKASPSERQPTSKRGGLPEGLLIQVERLLILPGKVRVVTGAAIARVVVQRPGQQRGQALPVVTGKEHMGVPHLVHQLRRGHRVRRRHRQHDEAAVFVQCPQGQPRIPALLALQAGEHGGRKVIGEHGAEVRCGIVVGADSGLKVVRLQDGHRCLPRLSFFALRRCLCVVTAWREKVRRLSALSQAAPIVGPCPGGSSGSTIKKSGRGAPSCRVPLPYFFLLVA